VVQIGEAKQELQEIFRDGRVSLIIGLIVVVVLLSASKAVLLLGTGRFPTVLSESMIIVAWVALRGAADSLLFSHFPVRRRQKLAQSPAQARVILQA
jgi:uncharacterized membrane protein